MNPPINSFDDDPMHASPHAARLLAQRGFVRALARRLVAPAAADDVAQEVLIAGLEHPPRESSALRSWLATATRHLAAKWRRGESRRDAREQAAARHEALPSTQELVAQVELEQTLARAVLDLREPERTTLLLRFHEGLTTAQIAARVGLPADTVRVRVRRGLDRLRAQLDTKFGAQAWVPLLLPVAGWKTAAVGATAASGGVLATATSAACVAGVSIMAVKGWLLAGLAGVTVVVAGVTTRSSWLPPSMGGVRARLDAPRADAPLADPAHSAALPDAAALGAQRELVGSDGSAGAGAEVALPQAGRVHLQVLDRDSGLPIEGEVAVRFLSEQRFAETTSGAAIDAALTAGRWTARLHARGYEPLELPEFTVDPALPLDLGHVVMARGNGVIEGDVIARHLALDAPVQVELRGYGRRRCADCLAPRVESERSKGQETEPAHGCGEGDEPTWFTLTGDRSFRFQQLAEGTYFLRAFDPARQIVEQRRVEVTRGGYVWQSLEVSAPTLARIELRHARGALFSGDWSSFHKETPTDLEFTIERDGKVIAQGNWKPDVEAVRASVGEPLVPLNADAVEPEGDGAVNQAITISLGRALTVYRVNEATTDLGDWLVAPSDGAIRVLAGDNGADRLDRARAEGDSLVLAANEPELSAAGLEATSTRPDAFALAPLPRALLTVTVRCGGYQSEPMVLDLRFGEPLPCVVPLTITDRRREELDWIALPVPESCTKCHEQRRGSVITWSFGDLAPDGSGNFQLDAGIEFLISPNADAPADEE